MKNNNTERKKKKTDIQMNNNKIKKVKDRKKERNIDK